MTIDELAEQCYLAYCESLGMVRTRGWRSWAELPDARKKAWFAVAEVKLTASPA